MLTLFSSVIATLGLLLYWPFLGSRILVYLTRPIGSSSLLLPPVVASIGLTRPDGLILLFGVVIILITAFMHTTRRILRLRIGLLGVLIFLITLEVITALTLGMPVIEFSGPLFSVFFCVTGFLAGVLKIGTVKSLTSQLGREPVSESQVFSRTFSRFMESRWTNVVRIFSSQKEEPVVFGQGKDIRIGRDRQWADYPIPPHWKMVSKRHAILRQVGNSLFYEPLARHYPFIVNGQSCNSSVEIKNGDQLHPVSGCALSLRIDLQQYQKPLLSQKNLNHAAAIARDEYRRLGFTLKFLIILMLLAVPLLVFIFQMQRTHFQRLQEQRVRQESTYHLRINRALRKWPAPSGTPPICPAEKVTKHRFCLGSSVQSITGCPDPAESRPTGSQGIETAVHPNLERGLMTGFTEDCILEATGLLVQYPEYKPVRRVSIIRFTP